MNTSGHGQPEDQHLLTLLDAVGKRADLSQRNLASQMGVALGLTNSYMKRCIRKGWVKIKTAPANRYLYYLTPSGFAEKSRLTARFLSNSLSFYREAGESCLSIYRACQEAGYGKILLAGDSDLAEIAAIRALEAGIEVAGVYDPDAERTRCAGRPIWKQYSEVAEHDAVVVTDLNNPRGILEHMELVAGDMPVLCPDILRII